MEFVSFICMKFPNIRIIHAIFVHAVKTQCMFMSRDQNAGRSQNMKVDKEILCKGGRVKIFGNNLNKQNSIQEEIKSRL